MAKSDLSTGNKSYASYTLKSNDLMFIFSAPYHSPNDPAAQESLRATQPHPGITGAAMRDFCDAHGLAVRAVGILVDDALTAYEQSVANGARGVLPPQSLGLNREDGGKGYQKMSEVSLYGDVVLRYMSYHDGATPTQEGNVFLPGYKDVDLEGREPLTYGLQRLDHAVGNVEDLLKAVDYIVGFTGMHQFAEFTAEDVGTVDSGLNSMVLANNNEMILLPVNEPTFGTKRKSQIQTYLEQNNGAGLQHLALKTDDIFATVRAMRAHANGRGGFDFQKPASEHYYRHLPERVGADALTPEQFAEVQELGLLVDRDDQGVLVQVFTKPLGDKPTIFIEVIQRIGCMREVKEQEDGENVAEGQRAKGAKSSEKGQVKIEQAAGCGGFGKGNFSELFKSVENYERTLKL